ncbi:MAG TPA: MFS transporter [Candidatus Limnocylindria bacterium]|nr:MFS transporter [Candidatus Limnocylindria bacterium]
MTRTGRIAFGVVLALAMGTSTFAGYAFGVLGPSLVDEFDISRSQLGLLTAVFFLVGGPLSLVAGPATDRFGARRVMLIAFAIAAATLVAMALAPGYPAMLVAASLAGLALATGNPVTNKLVAVHLPSGTRGLVMGGKQAGVQVGAFMAGALLAPLAAQFGWRAALGWVALVPIAAMVAAVVVVPSDSTSAAEPNEPDAPLSLPSGVRWLAVYAFLMGSGVATVNAYLPLYLVESAGASQELAGVVVATIGLVGIFSRLVWGWASERMPTFSLPLLMLGGGSVVAIGLILAIEQFGLWVAWPAAILFGATAVTWNAVGNLAVITESGTGLAGRASGLLTFGFYMGFVGSPVLFGLLVDATGSYTLAWSLVGLGFAATVFVIMGWRRSAAHASVPASRSA